MKKVVLISHHYYKEKRKAGFQCLAHAFSKLNWEVIFVTSPIGLLSFITNDYRMTYPIKKEMNKSVKISYKVSSYILLSLFTPENVNNYRPFKKLPFFGNFINKILTVPYFFFGKYIPKKLEKIISDADLIIFESTPAILYFNSIKKICQRAKFIYRVSDDLEFLNCHPYVIFYERKIAEKFDLISVPSDYIFKKFSNYSHTILHYHGIQKELFEKEYKKPDTYKNFEINIIFIGNSYFDEKFIHIAANLFPTWGFHIIGPFEDNWKRDNVIVYGELPFSETIPFLKFANIGLQTRIIKDGFSSLSDSLKVIQYTWLKLPIIAPFGLNSQRINIFYYHPDREETIKEALLSAINFDRSLIDNTGILSWRELVEELIKEVALNNNRGECI